MKSRSGHWLLPRPLRWAWYRLWKNVYRLWLTLVNRLRAEGLEHLPSGPYLVIANHQSLHDPPIIGTNIPGEFHPLARDTLFKVPVFGWGIANCNSIPVRQDGGQDRAAIQACIDRLKEGGIVAVFPEGSRTFDGAIHEFLAGASLVARKAAVPVVPAAIKGAYEVWPRTSKLPRLGGKIRVKYGPPISPEGIKGMKGAEATALFESEVRRLYGELP